MMLKLPSFASWRRSVSGIATVEAALVAPVLIILLIGLVDIGRYVSDRGKMTRAVKSGSHYFMVGGGDVDAARTIIRSNLANAFGDRYAPTVTVTQYCQCGASVNACNTNCSNGNAPNAYFKMTMNAEYKGVFLNRAHEIDDEVRIR